MGNAVLEHDHLSGRYTATTREQEVAFDEIMSDETDLLTTTEVDKNSRARCLREKGWWSVFGDKGPRDDCGIAGRRERLERLYGDTTVLSDLTYKTERGTQSSRTVGAFAVVKDKRTGLTGVVAVAHLPHGMQDEIRTGKIRSDVARAYRDIVRGLKREANRLARVWKAAWTMIVGDFNIDVKRLWVQAYLKRTFPTYKVNWTRPFPTAGTFGGRIIDLAMLRGLRVRRGPKIEPRHEGFDHRGFSEGLVAA